MPEKIIGSHELTKNIGSADIKLPNRLTTPSSPVSWLPLEGVPMTSVKRHDYLTSEASILAMERSTRFSPNLSGAAWYSVAL